MKLTPETNNSKRIEGLKVCLECNEVIETKDVFKHNNKHPKKAGVMYKQLMESDLQ